MFTSLTLKSHCMPLKIAEYRLNRSFEIRDLTKVDHKRMYFELCALVMFATHDRAITLISGFCLNISTNAKKNESRNQRIE